MNELEFINRLKHHVEESTSSFIRHPSSLVCGIGDDAAVFKSPAGNNVVITADLLIEDIDFRRETPAEYLGHKSLAVSLSDIAAMGARPRWALVSLGLPNAVWDTNFTDDFYKGFLSLAAGFGVTLIGGDVSRTPDKVVVDSIVIGECHSGSEVLRSGAKPGDQIFVTGYLGDAAAGLRLWERGARFLSKPANEQTHEQQAIERLLRRQLKPDPRVGWGMVIGEQHFASAMIDISDGLSSDLNHLCDESKVGALVEAGRIPIDPLVVELSGRRALDPLMLALHGGEDFELLLTVAPENIAKLPKRVDGASLTRIGEIKDASHGVHISEGARTWKLEPGGWQHFHA